MDENGYIRDAPFRQNHEPLSFQPEESEYMEKKQECCDEVNTKVHSTAWSKYHTAFNMYLIAHPKSLTI
ncbi:hypothetical protein COA09_28340 [Bacillus cereus]|nr:hypothetical protein COL00_14335 [Bacillus cereus]PGQ04622.1 hypothetical protein COA09_28340 [Bacillus cereus]PGS44497.1 hypothetical protein COC67_31125 [Bacillus cereus]PGU90203.1 hypothetical protein COD77_30615 [Bacillus cereus]